MDHFIMRIRIWLISHRKIKPCFFIYDTLVMREGIKTSLAVIGAHSGRAEAAESHFTRREMDDGVVDAATTKSA